MPNSKIQCDLILIAKEQESHNWPMDHSTLIEKCQICLIKDLLTTGCGYWLLA